MIQLDKGDKRGAERLYCSRKRKKKTKEEEREAKEEEEVEKNERKMKRRRNSKEKKSHEDYEKANIWSEIKEKEHRGRGDFGKQYQGQPCIFPCNSTKHLVGQKKKKEEEKEAETYLEESRKQNTTFF